MNLTRFAVYRPVIALAIAAAILLVGLVSYSSLGLEQNPQLNLPIVTVQIAYPGASARSVEEQVTRRVEDAIAGLGNVKTITSNSRNSLATVTVEFREGVNVDVAANDLQQRVSGVRRDLPAEAEEPSYSKLDFNDVPILYLAITSERGADAVQLFRVADDQVRPRIESVQGVGRVVVAGGQEPEVQVEVLPDKLRAYGLSVNDVANAVHGQFLSVSGGVVKGGSGDATTQATLRVDSRAGDVATLGALPVLKPDGSGTELRNVANVYLGGKEAEQILRVNGRPAAGLLVYKQSSANIAQTVDAVAPLVAQVNRELPPGYRLTTAIDRSTSVRQTVSGVQEELVLAAIICGIVLFFFLHSLRSTLIVLLAIPACLLIALIAMWATGYTLNSITLIGLTTAIGVLVDDSIVVLENIFKYLERGEESRQAAVDGRSEIGLAAIAITLVDVAVWGPVMFVTGITGAFLRNFSLVIVAATLASLLVSFTLTPLIASRWLKRDSQQGRGGLARLAALWEPGYVALERGYEHALRWSLRHRPLVLIAAVLIFGVNLVVVPKLGNEFVPKTNNDSVNAIGELPPGTALEAADAVAQRWEAALLDKTRFPEIQTAYVLVGRGDSDADREPRFISVTLGLGEPSSRVRTSDEIGKAAVAAGQQASPLVRAHLGDQFGNGQGQPVQIRIFGNDLDQLGQVARGAQRRLSALPELTYVTNSLVVAPELVVTPDPTRLKDLGLDTQTVGSTLRIAYQGSVVGRWAEPSGKERDVRVRLPDELRHDPRAVAALPLIRRGNEMLTIRQVATDTEDETPNKITRVDRQRIALLGAEPNGVPLGSASAAATATLDALDLPAGMRWGFTGQSDSQQESFRQLGIGLGMSVILMYLVLTILYESVLYPLLILTALPLATVGAFLGLLVFDQTLSVPSFIGLIALFGLVGKNSILLVDRTNHLRRQGISRTAALEQAGPSRLRPILMTSLVLVLAMLPVALKLGDGGDLRAPLGAVLVGGMATSTVLSLLYVPVAYTYFDSFQTLVGRLFRWRPRLSVRRLAGPRALRLPRTEQSPPARAEVVVAADADEQPDGRQPHLVGR